MAQRFPVLVIVALATLASSPVAAQPDDDGFALEVGGGAALLERLGITEAERGTALVLLARGLHGVAGQGPAGGLSTTVTEVLGPPPVPGLAGAAPSPPDPVDPVNRATIRAPMSERAWRRALALDTRGDLFRALLQHRGALLVAAGAIESGPGVQEWLEAHPRTLAEIVRQWSGAFAVAASALALDGDGWRVPGGPAMAAAWTSLTGASPTRADDFLRRLLAKDGGRLARFYATLARLDDEWLAAVTAPLPGEDAARALAALYALAHDAEPPALPNTHPFQLGYGDLASVLLALDDLTPSRLPASAGRWAVLLDARIDSRAEAAAVVAATPSPQPLAAVVRAQLRGAPRERRDRVTMVALARRVWRGDEAAEAQADTVYAVAHYARFRGLLLMLDRIGIDDAGAWAVAVDAARRVEDGPSGGRAARLDMFQGALALVERTTLAGSLDINAATRVVRALATMVMAAPLDAAVRDWLLDSFIPALPPLVRPDRFSGRTAYESRVLQALAGPPDGAVTPLEWEGLPYDVDLTAAEHDRLVRLRTLLPSPGLDAAIESGEATALAAALRTLAYVPAMGDPDGAITLSPDVVERHDYGGRRSMPGRHVAWTPAQERTGTGAPWHALGSLLGLDLAFSRLALRRLSADDMPPVPTINLNDQIILTRTAVALHPRQLSDLARDELAAAIARGRARVREAAANPVALLDLGRAAGWTAAEQSVWQHERLAADDAEGRFSLRQLLALGAPAIDGATLDRWGILAEALDGRLTTRMDRPRPWDHVTGRSDTGMLATQVPDLTLRLVEVTAARRLPARLIPSLLLYATQDYWHDVEARFADDWPAMVRGAARLPATRVEDYVAALASGGPLRAK